MSLAAGARLNHYEVIAQLGEGGMGEVYRALDSTLGRHVALKLLPPDLARDPVRIDRFRREARTVASLNHPHIVTIYSVEQDAATGAHFLTMELVEGESLDRQLPTEWPARAETAGPRRHARRCARRGARQAHRASRSEARQRDADG